MPVDPPEDDTAEDALELLPTLLEDDELAADDDELELTALDELLEDDDAGVEDELELLTALLLLEELLEDAGGVNSVVSAGLLQPGSAGQSIRPSQSLSMVSKH